MTWLDEDIEEVEEAIMNAVDNTKYPNTIDELFDGDTWVVHFRYIAQEIKDNIEDDCERWEINEISKDLVRQYIDRNISIYVQDFILNVYDNVLDQLSDDDCVKVKN